MADEENRKPLFLSPPDGSVEFGESIHHPEFHMDWRNDDFFKLVFLLKCSVRYFAKEQENSILLSEGDFLAISPGIWHRIEDQEPSTLLILCLSKTFVERSSEDLLASWRQIENRSESIRPNSVIQDRIRHFWRSALGEQASHRLGNESLKRAIATSIIVTLARSDDDNADAMQRVRMLADLLEQEYYDEWDIEKACRVTNLSRRHFSQCFKQCTGLTFVDKLTEVRLNKAADLLSSRERSIASVSFSCGFNDLSHFYRVFKKRYGIPPGKWAAS